MAIEPCKHGHFSKRGAQGKCLECSRNHTRAYRTKQPGYGREQSAAYYAKNREKRNADSRRYHAADPRRAMLRHAAKRAKLRRYACTITLEDIVIPEFCPLLGVRLQTGNRQSRDNSPSLDKIKPSLGYVPGNVWVISQRANALKGNATTEELELLVANLKKHALTMPWDFTMLNGSPWGQ